MGTVGYAPGFKVSVKVVAHTVENKGKSILIASSFYVPHIRL